MPILNKNRIFDGFANLAGGMDAGRNPSLIGLDQCASAENMVFRGGVPKARPGFRATYRAQTNPDMRYFFNGFFLSANGGAGQSATNFSSGVFQGAGYYAPGSGKPAMMMAMVSGRLYQIVPRTDIGSAGVSSYLEVTEIALAKTNSPNLAKAYFVQADRFCVIQDGQSKAIVYDGVVAYRSDDIPVGTIMTYGMGRLIVVVNDFREIVFGDLYGSHAEDSTDPGRSVLRFEETGFLNEGGTANIAFSLGKLSGLHFMPQQDSSVGDGELLAFSEGGVTSFQLALPRDQWKQSAFQRVVLYNVGARGWRSIVSITEDVWFRGDDGWRSYRQARAEQQGWAHLPMSTEVRPWIENDTISLLDYGSAIYFDNRLVGTCTPYPNGGRLFHNGLLALDFDVLSSFGTATKPAWDGHWSKMRVSQLVTGTFNDEQRAWAFVLDDNDLNQLREITRNDYRDYSASGAAATDAVTWELIPRSMDFKEPFNEKELWGADLWLYEVDDATTITLSYRPDQHSIWTTWQTLPAILPVGTAQEITPGGVPTILAGFFPRRTIIKPENDVDGDSFTGRMMRRGYEFQPRIRGTGHCAIRKLRLHAQDLTETDRATVP